MNSSIENKLSEILSGMDGEKLKNSVDAVSRFMATEEGKRLKKSLSEEDKKALTQKIMNMNSGEAAEKLKKADLSGIKNLSAEDILKGLK